jgi:hypothetical protein
MPRAGFEPTILASERPQTHALDRAATGIITALDRTDWQKMWREPVPGLETAILYTIKSRSCNLPGSWGFWMNVISAVRDTLSELVISVVWLYPEWNVISVVWHTLSEYVVSVVWHTLSEYVISVVWHTLSEYVISVVWHTLSECH